MMPSGPSADPIFVFSQGFFYLSSRNYVCYWFENWSARLMVASRNTMSTICVSVVTVPPSMAAKDLTHPSTALVALATGMPSSPTISGIG